VIAAIDVTLAKGIVALLTVPRPDPKVIVALDRIGASYEIMACDPELADTAQFCAAYGIPPEQSANAILVSSRRPPGERAVCLVLATTRLDVNGTVRRRLQVKKVSFASEEETIEVTGMEIGGVTPFGLPEGLRVWIDAAVLEPDWVIVGAGSRSAKIKLDPRVFRALGDVEIVAGLAGPPQEQRVPDDTD
jgi:prolyl-tRNA editing enzyme YbaK/EbsC (Cys-tRNA(Pro) deacylase)